MELAPFIIAISSSIVTFALAASFAVGWYGGRNFHFRRPSDKPVTEQETNVSRIALADLRVRMRRLEAIAAGIDL